MITQTNTTSKAIRELKDCELDAVNGGFYPGWEAVAMYVATCAAIGIYLGKK